MALERYDNVKLRDPKCLFSPGGDASNGGKCIVFQSKIKVFVKKENVK